MCDLQIYGRLRDKVTPNGFTLDQVIQCGVDNPGKKGAKEGKNMGIVAGDEESYEVTDAIFFLFLSQHNQVFIALQWVMR